MSYQRISARTKGRKTGALRRWAMGAALFGAVAVLGLNAGAGESRPSGLTPEQRLGKQIFFDRNLSEPIGQSCASCHDPAWGFSSPNAAVNAAGAVVPGAVRTLAGFRKPPSAAYAMFSPPLHYDAEDDTYVGGLFWDGRAADLAAQARQPFLNPLEQNNPHPATVCLKVARASYAPLFRAVYGRAAVTAQSDPAAMYSLIVRAIAAFESSAEVNAFSSKYDLYLAGQVVLTPQEQRGLVLYEGKANCAACHPNQAADDGTPPLFTDFTYDNIGVPRNPDNPFYRMPTSVNPAGAAYVDPGLETTTNDPAQRGRFKVPTLRNIGKKPVGGLAKSYMHNGAFHSLREVVHFYNTRDLGTFPPPEVEETMNREELGNLGMTASEEEDLVAFLTTLSDGYRAPAHAAR